MISLMPGDSILSFKGALIKLDRTSNRFFDIVGWRKLARHIVEFSPDIVQANAGDTLKFSVLSKLLFGWKAPIFFRNANKVSDFIDSRPKLIFNRFLMNRLAHVISVSELCRRDFIHTYSYQPAKATTVPIGIDLHPFNRSLPHDLTTIFANGKVLVHVGSFVPEKNHIGLLRIVEKVLAKGIHVKLVLIGDGALRTRIEKEISDRNLSNHVFLLGYRNDVLSIMANADVFVLPSRIEGLPGVILEAMYGRLPVVAYDVGGISEVVKSGETGWLVTPGDEAGFVKAIEESLSVSNIEAVKDNAHNLVVTDYDNRMIARRFLKAYHPGLRVLQLVQRPQLRGAEIFASQLSNCLIDEGHEVLMISLLPGDAILPFKGRLIKLNRHPRERFNDVAGWKQLANYIKEFRPDVVQANAGDTLKFAALSKLLFRWKVPVIYRNASKVGDYVDSWQKLYFNRFLLRQVRHVISVSELCRQDFIKTYSYLPDLTTLVPIGIDLHAVNESLPADLKSIFSSGKVLVHVGGFTPEKNHSGLIRIAKSLLDKGEDIKLLLIGHGRLRSLIKKEVKAKKLGDRIFLLGYRNDVLSIMRNASAFILPSNIEGLPGVILEALYCRLPVIAYDVGGVSEVVKPGETGWLVRAGDEEAFVSAVLSVLHSANLGVVGKNAHDMVVNDYDNKVIALRFLDVYRKNI